MQKIQGERKMKKEFNKRKLFEKIWDNYWWKKRDFCYRINTNEADEREIIALAFESFFKLLEDKK